MSNDVFLRVITRGLGGSHAHGPVWSEQAHQAHSNCHPVLAVSIKMLVANGHNHSEWPLILACDLGQPLAKARYSLQSKTHHPPQICKGARHSLCTPGQ